MKYMGSKSRIAKHIIPIMVNAADEVGIDKWVEPFVGGANLIDKVPERFERVGYDKNRYLIALLSALTKGFIPNDNYSREEYIFARDNKDINPVLTGYIGINCSYGGKWFDGYAGVTQTKSGVRDYQSEAKANVMKQSPLLQDVRFLHSEYQELDFENCLIYCDPPYHGTRGYNKMGGFDHAEFFAWCRRQANKNIVFLSEYNAPKDFECVWEKEVTISLSANGSSGGSKKSVEKLFRVR